MIRFILRYLLRLVGLPRAPIATVIDGLPRPQVKLVHYSWPTFRRGRRVGTKTRFFVTRA